MGGAQPLGRGDGLPAPPSNASPRASRMRLRTRYLDQQARTLDEALAMIDQANKAKSRSPVGLLGNAVDIFPELVRRGVRPDAVTTRPRRTTRSTLPAEGLDDRAVGATPQTIPTPSAKPRASDGRACARHARLPSPGHPGRRLRQQHPPRWPSEEGVKDASTSGLRARPTSGRCSAAASGRSAGPLCRAIRRISTAPMPRWKGVAARQLHALPLARHGARAHCLPGLPARICWVGPGDRHRLGRAFNQRWWPRASSCAVVIGRDHLDSGSRSLSPNRETESMKDGSDAVSDWPMLNALLNCASGATGCRRITWRRRRYRLLPACRHGDRARRHAGSRASDRTRWERPGHRRHAPCR